MLVMASVAKKITKERKWSKKDSAEFMEHLQERGYAVVLQTKLEKLNKFVVDVTQGLNVNDPDNAGRGIALVWKDHLEVLNDIAKVVLALGLAQRDIDKSIADGKQEGTPEFAEAAERIMKARSTIEKLARELASKELTAREAIQTIEVDQPKSN